MQALTTEFEANDTAQDSPFRAVGRFHLIGFKLENKRPVAVIDYSHHDREGVPGTDFIGTRESYTYGQVGVLNAVCDDPEEKAYLVKITEAIDFLDGATMFFENLLQSAFGSAEEWQPTKDVVSEHLDRFRDLLGDLYKSEKAPGYVPPFDGPR